jgi:hypothetical protein
MTRLHLTRRRGLSTVSLALALALASTATGAPQNRALGITPLQSSAIDFEAARALDAEIARVAQKAGARLPPDSAAFATMLEELGTRGLRCTAADVECLAKIGIYAGLDLLLVPYHDLGALGPRLCARLVDVGSARSLRLECVGQAGELEPLPAHASKLVRQVLTGESRSGGIELQVNVTGAQILLDGELVGSSPLDGPLEAIPHGQHWIQVQAEGYRTDTQSVSVLAGEQSDLAVTLVKLENRPPAREPVADSDSTEEPTVASPGEVSTLGWAGGAVLGLGVLGLAAFTATGVAGGVMYDEAPTATGCAQDPGAEACLARRDARATGQLLAYTGLIGGAVAAVVAVMGAVMVGVEILE